MPQILRTNPFLRVCAYPAIFIKIRSLVTTLVQSEALGASVAQTMRVFAQQTRDARYLDAERRASELPVKMAFPLVLFIFPSLMTVIFTPLIIRILRQLLQMG